MSKGPAVASSSPRKVSAVKGGGVWVGRTAAALLGLVLHAEGTRKWRGALLVVAPCDFRPRLDHYCSMGWKRPGFSRRKNLLPRAAKVGASPARQLCTGPPSSLCSAMIGTYNTRLGP